MKVLTKSIQGSVLIGIATVAAAVSAYPQANDTASLPSISALTAPLGQQISAELNVQLQSLHVPRPVRIRTASVVISEALTATVLVEASRLPPISDEEATFQAVRTAQVRQ
jgi:hypothetical protein